MRRREIIKIAENVSYSTGAYRHGGLIVIITKPVGVWTGSRPYLKFFNRLPNRATVYHRFAYAAW